MNFSSKIDSNRIFDTHIDTKKIFVPLHFKFVLRNYVRNDGKCALYLHITGNGTRKRVALNLFLKKSQWLSKQQRAKKELQDLNLILERIQSHISEIKIQYRLAKRVLTMDRFLEEFKNNFSRTDFVAFFGQQLIEDGAKLRPRTFKRYQVVFRKFKKYKRQLLFSDFDYQVLDGFCQYLTKIGNSKNTVSSNIKVIKKYLNRAKRYGISFPINTKDIKPKERYHDRQGLKPNEVEDLYNYFSSGFIPEAKRLVLGYFLFSCFTGLRLGDIVKLERSQISNEFRIVMNKNQKPLTVHLIDKAKKLLALEPLLFKKKLTGEYMNRELKKIAVAVGIHQRLTYHISRHTFAVSYLRMGGSPVYLQQLMGHADLKTTMGYVRILEEEQNKEIHLLDNLF